MDFIRESSYEIVQEKVIIAFTLIGALLISVGSITYSETEEWEGTVIGAGYDEEDTYILSVKAMLNKWASPSEISHFLLEDKAHEEIQPY